MEGEGLSCRTQMLLIYLLAFGLVETKRSAKLIGAKQFYVLVMGH